MKRAGIVLGALVWFMLVFLVSFRMTFPSDAISERIRFEVQEQSSGAYALDMSDLSPWWVGASASNVQLHKVGVAEPELAFAAESARVRVGLASLLRGAPRLTGGVQIGAGELDFVVGTRMNQKGTALTISELAVGAPGFPLSDLASIVGAAMEATGDLDIDVQLDASDTMRTATGKATVRGSDLLIDKLDLSDLGVPDLGMAIPIDDIDLALQIADGKATFTSGVIRSPLATFEIEGDITLRDDLERSTINVALLVGQLGTQLTPFKGFFGEEWADGKFHYRCSGTLSRNSCRPDRERSSTSSAGSKYTPASRLTTTPPTRPETPGSPTRAAPMDDEERQRRKDELRERLRQRREERAAVPERTRGASDGEDEEFVEEELGDGEEDLPPEEEFFEELGDEDFEDQ